MKVEIIDSDEWTIRRYHGRIDRGIGRRWRRHWRHWRLTDLGIQVAGDESVRRTKGKPVTVGRIVEAYGEIILKWADAFDLPEQLIAAVIAAESGGKPAAERYEKHLDDWSIGLGQTLTSTARQLYKEYPGALPNTLTPEPVPAGGSVAIWRGVLGEPDTSIGLIGAYMRRALDRFKLRMDPVLMYCAYNAGSVRAADDSAWGIKHYRHEKDGELVFSALDSFVAWFGDACDVYGSCETIWP